MHDQKSTTVAKCLFGISETLHADQGHQFESVLVKSLCEFRHVMKTRTSPQHPQCDGAVERFNRTPINQLTRMLLRQANYVACLTQNPDSALGASTENRDYAYLSSTEEIL
ncbi:hypothetical protein SKAU_G00142290 [Synaphobranchus kaupii]|uniref:Integrase catalytic domain-containing protein n=1 Tax=Synaphobranchus kaupii TaxID=118154 RepID=A0A9Q1FSQ1_SYNKA|nr:hypothetical protein SKAU_G00142290 [Synaphobranchus kaupii]